jgi:thiol-disulfide isomerase/thioredoxin
MNSKKDYKVILSKVEWCGHCKDFLPVFNKSKNLIKNNNMFKNVNMDFEVYDMEQDKGIFETKYGELVDKVEGYPTVFLAQIKNDKLSKTVEIGHAKESEDFIKLLGDAYKSFSAQKGGFEEDDIYKQKYLKYKAKYFFKNNLQGGANGQVGDSSFYIGNVYYLLTAPSQKFLLNPRPDILRINLTSELAPFNIDELGFSTRHEYSNYWFDLNIVKDGDTNHQTLRSLSIFNFDENLRIPPYKINSIVQVTSDSLPMYIINEQGIVTEDRYKNFFTGIKLNILKYEVLGPELTIYTIKIENI